MIGDAMIITVSVCLFIYLGLFDAISSVLGRILPATPGKTERIFEKLKCSKCISFWLTLAYGMTFGCSVIHCILVSFLCAFLRAVLRPRLPLCQSSCICPGYVCSCL